MKDQQDRELAYLMERQRRPVRIVRKTVRLKPGERPGVSVLIGEGLVWVGIFALGAAIWFWA